MAVSAAVRWCAVAVERKHGGSCGCSSSLVYFFFPLSLPFLSSASPKRPPSFCNISPVVPCSLSFFFLPPPSFCCFGLFLFTPFSLENLLFLSFGLSFLSKKNCQSLSPGLSSLFSFFFPLCHYPSLLLQNFAPPLFGFLPSGFYRQAERESPHFYRQAERESPHYLVPSWRRRETGLPYPCRARWPVVYRAWVLLMVAR